MTSTHRNEFKIKLNYVNILSIVFKNIDSNVKLRIMSSHNNVLTILTITLISIFRDI